MSSLSRLACMYVQICLCTDVLGLARCQVLRAFDVSLSTFSGRLRQPPRSASSTFTRHNLDSANAAAVTASPLTPPHQDAAPPPLPSSVVYKLSCERFSWPQLEPQVSLQLPISGVCLSP